MGDAHGSSRAVRVKAHLALALAVVGLARMARAHPVVVDGQAGDWFSHPGTQDDDGSIVARDAGGRGEWIFRDHAGDTIAAAGSVPRADITRVQVTGTATSLSVMVRLVQPLTADVVPEVVLAIDLDRIALSGQTSLGDGVGAQVSDQAAWERLVRTHFGPGTGADVVSTTFTPVGTATAARGADGIELDVPWSSLGLSGPPSSPIRLSLVTLHGNAQGIVDFPGTAPNVVDAITDYGQPGTTLPTEDEFASDGASARLDYFADVWLAPSGDVYAPVLISRFQAAPAAASFVELTNVSPGALPLGGWLVGDAARPRRGERLGALPSSVVLGPGGTCIVAKSAAGYAAAHGAPPCAEFDGTSAAVPDALPSAEWAGGVPGQLLWLDTGDEAVVLDPQLTISDVIAYGSGAYPPVVRWPNGLAARQGLLRNAALSDTDDVPVDFTLTGPTDAGVPLPPPDAAPPAGPDATTPIATSDGGAPDGATPGREGGVPHTPPDASAEGGRPLDAGARPDASAPRRDAGGSGATGPRDASADAAARSAGSGGDDSGCGCRLGGRREERRDGPGLAALAALTVFGLRRHVATRRGRREERS
jgi:hypothetical protein